MSTASSPPHPAASSPLVRLEGIWKVFNGVPVLRDVHITLQQGQIHALLGGNGSGKSTTMKILSGVYQPDAGRIVLQGQPVTLATPAVAHQMGVYMVPQEPHIFPHLSVEENLLTGLGIPAGEARERISQLAEEIGFRAPLHMAAGGLSIANQQLLEIMRGLLRKAQILIFDEPTSALTFREVEHLFEKMRALAAQGIGMFFISHRLGEVLEISDRVTVLRDGRVVLTEPTEALSSQDLVNAMLPEEGDARSGAEQSQTSGAASGSKDAALVLEVRDFSGEAFGGVSLTVKEGEVVGLAGLVGAGRTELAEAIVGLREHSSGEVFIGGERVASPSPRQVQEMGLVYVPEDRHAHGIFLDLPHLYTITASILPRLGQFLLSFSQEEAVGKHYVDRLQIKAKGLWQIARTLSGGNQQKVVLAKALATNPRCIILDEPTRGVDARARRDVYRLIAELKEQGVGILLISSEMEEIVEFSDRVLVMYQGAIIGEIPREQVTLEKVVRSSFGVIGEQVL